MLIIYRKSDGQPFLQEAISSFFTKETYDSTHNYDHVVKNFGGIKGDYSEIWLDDESIIQKTYTHEFTVQNGKIIFGAEKVVDDSPQEPSEIEMLNDYIIDVDYRLTLVGLGLY